MSYHARRGRRLRSLAPCGTVAGGMACGHPLRARRSQDRGTPAGAREAGAPPEEDRIVALQRSAGNQAVARLLARTPTATTPGGGVTDVAELDRLLGRYSAAEDWGGMAWILLR